METTDDQVKAVIHGVLTGTQQAEGGRTTYLRTLIAASQEAIGKKRGLDPKEQLKALKATHSRFYALAMAAVELLVPAGTKGRARELHRQINFTRTALSAVRRHVQGGGDLAALQADKATKQGLLANVKPREMTIKRLRSKAANQSKALIATLVGLTGADKAAAIEEIQLALGRLNGQLASMGVVMDGSAKRNGRRVSMPVSAGGEQPSMAA